jgi:hypothetical protein
VYIVFKFKSRTPCQRLSLGILTRKLCGLAVLLAQQAPPLWLEVQQQKAQPFALQLRQE